MFKKALILLFIGCLSGSVLGIPALSTVVQLSTILVDPTTTSNDDLSPVSTALTVGDSGNASSLSSGMTSGASSNSSTIASQSSSTGIAPTTGAGTTISAPQTDRSSAPIAGPNKSAACCHLWANIPSEDWLFATLCSWADAHPKWPLANLDYAEEFTDPLNLPAVNVSLYNGGLNLEDPITLSYTGVKGNGNSDPNEAWWGGAFRNAFLYSNSTYGVVNVDDDEFRNNQDRDQAGYWGLFYLTGHMPVTEDVGQYDRVLWELWLDNARSSPITILSKRTTTKVLKDANRYFSVINFDRDNSMVLLWDPTAGGTSGFFQVDSDALREDVSKLYHLGWTSYSEVPRKHKGI